MKYSLIFGLILCVISCKNPFGNDNITSSESGFSIANTENGEILLRLKPNVGDKTNLQMAVNLEPKGMIVSLDTHFVGDLKLRVRDVDENANHYTVDFQRIQFETSILGAKIEYDSQGDNTNIPQQLQNELQTLLANQVKMELDSLARFQSIEFNQEKSDVSTQNIDFNFLFVPMPENAVKVGDSWAATQKVENIGNVELVYTIEKIADTEVLVFLSTVDNKVHGQYLIDRQTGFTKKANVEVEAEKDGKGLHMQMNIKSISLN